MPAPLTSWWFLTASLDTSLTSLCPPGLAQWPTGGLLLGSRCLCLGAPRRGSSAYKSSPAGSVVSAQLSPPPPPSGLTRTTGEPVPTETGFPTRGNAEPSRGLGVMLGQGLLCPAIMLLVQGLPGGAIRLLDQLLGVMVRGRRRSGRSSPSESRLLIITKTK